MLLFPFKKEDAIRTNGIMAPKKVYRIFNPTTIMETILTLIRAD